MATYPDFSRGMPSVRPLTGTNTTKRQKSLMDLYNELPRYQSPTGGTTVNMKQKVTSPLTPTSPLTNTTATLSPPSALGPPATLPPVTTPTMTGPAPIPSSSIGPPATLPPVTVPPVTTPTSTGPIYYLDPNERPALPPPTGPIYYLDPNERTAPQPPYQYQIPDDVKNAPGVNQLKSQMDKFYQELLGRTPGQGDYDVQVQGLRAPNSGSPVEQALGLQQGIVGSQEFNTRFGTASEGISNPTAQADKWVRGYLGRPMTQAEMSALTPIYTQAGGGVDGLNAVKGAILNSPEFKARLASMTDTRAGGGWTNPVQ